jgi:phosphatidylserine decarboxylase
MHAVPAKTLLSDDLRFLLSNHIPRQLANRFFGWFSQIDSPTLARASIAVWRLFADLDLSEARTQRFRSLHACFTRELKAGARPVDGDPHVITSLAMRLLAPAAGSTVTSLSRPKDFPTSYRSFCSTRSSSNAIATANTSRCG